MSREIPKAYEPQEIEERWAKAWYEDKLFRAENSGEPGVPGDQQPRFSIALPPPNVTGSIHIGHMLEHTQIDMLVRWHRMRGERTLWLPGMDHAGIATQFVVERMLAKEGIQRKDLGREEFERRVWKWKAESGGVIKQQMIRLGASCDWTRERFTLEPALYRAVLEAFLRLYREGLIYRGRYMVNWCPRCQTAISDLEVVHNERTGNLWFIRYPVAGSPQEYLVVATTRPETMLGDTAAAVHPEDERYRHLVGKKVLLPLMNREIPIIADAYVDREFGTGVVKITPAHDPNDFEMGKRHGLAEIDVMTDDAHMNEAAGKYAGLERFVARARVIADLEELGLMDRISEHTHSVGTCDRCKAIVEPRISTQWFMKMKPLAEEARKAVTGEFGPAAVIEVVPDNQRTILLQWLENIRDWCISRQLWWGHRIPIWHCADCKEMVPATDSSVSIVDGHARAAGVPISCPKCGGAKLTQDKDVLDTWFSSALWPFSTLGWPDDTEDLRTFYPTSLLISGYDILFFWDARMIMMGLHLAPGATEAQRIPFRRLYLHSLVRTAEGAKMSKTKGTGVDPLQLTQQYGTDALRYMLASMSAPGTDIALAEDRILGARAFANKIWNAARFLFLNLDKAQQEHSFNLEDIAGPNARADAPYLTGGDGDLINRWIFARLSAVIAEANKAFEEFRFHEACRHLYEFFWGDFCDWYIEWVKPYLTSNDERIASSAWKNIFVVLETSLRLLHPVMPFLTEELWQKIPQPAGAKSIALASYPGSTNVWHGVESLGQMQRLQEVVLAVRQLRAERKLDPRRRVSVVLSVDSPSYRSELMMHEDPLCRLAILSELKVVADRIPAGGKPARASDWFELIIEDIGESAEERVEAIARLDREIDRLERDVAAKTERLGDEEFLTRAPHTVVQNLRLTLVERALELKKLRDQRAQMS
ncbi:MAG: valine--tRNA ligase [Candidatus Acidiferrales bacterium]